MGNERLLRTELTEVIIKGFYHVYNTLGYGFLEKVYENALTLTLRKWGLSVGQQVRLRCTSRARWSASITRT
jgi:GxxExxY protein